MNKNELESAAQKFLLNSSNNYISKDNALLEYYVGMKIYENPIFAFGRADDEYFKKFKNPEAIGSHFMMPDQWLICAKTVISYFLPFTEQVKESNKKDFLWPSNEWLNARIEGQKMLNELSLFIQNFLIEKGYEAVSPSIDKRFKIGATVTSNGIEKINTYTSNWSERHAAFACGMGTFSLTKALITKVGMAGRMGSVITDFVPQEYTIREYNDLYEYCSMCGVCIKNCPVSAISKEKGKNHFVCDTFLNKIKEKHNPYYGCGKCQVKVPCESRIPFKKAK